jgi:cytochrome b involved in lipid metabolism
MEKLKNHKDKKDEKEKVIIIIDDYKFDVSTFLKEHPGGAAILRKYHQKDATKAFNSVKGHCDGYVDSLLDKFCIGKK